MDKRVWYAVLMDNGDGPPVGMWNKEELAQLVCDKQPKGHRDIVIAVVPAAALAAATERAEAAERASDRLRAFCDAIDNMIPDGISHEGADTDDRVRDLVWRYVNTIARADALAARLREVDDREHPA